MNSADPDDEIDPNDVKFKVDPSTIPDLPPMTLFRKKPTINSNGADATQLPQTQKTAPNNSPEEVNLPNDANDKVDHETNVPANDELDGEYDEESSDDADEESSGDTDEDSSEDVSEDSSEEGESSTYEDRRKSFPTSSQASSMSGIDYIDNDINITDNPTQSDLDMMVDKPIHYPFLSLPIDNGLQAMTLSSDQNAISENPAPRPDLKRPAPGSPPSPGNNHSS